MTTVNKPSRSGVILLGHSTCEGRDLAGQEDAPGGTSPSPTETAGLPMPEFPEFSALPSRGPCQTVLVLFPEPAIRELVASNLRQAGLFTLEAASVAQARRLAGEVRPDLALIDLDAHDAAEGPVSALLREGALSEGVPTFLLAADPAAACGPRGETCGATRCLAKPFSPRALVGEIVRQLRGAAGAHRPLRHPLRVGPVEADPAELRVTLRRGQQREAIAVSSVEMRLLCCLMEQPDRLLTRGQIVEAVWGPGSAVDARTVDQNIRRLRRRIEALGAARLIQTMPGLGYRFSTGMPLPDDDNR